MKFYYTFGPDPGFPFHRGWIEVIADNREKADALFRAMYPDRTPGILNCAFVYTEEQFKETLMYKGHPGEQCHGTLGFFVATEEHPETVYVFKVHAFRCYNNHLIFFEDVEVYTDREAAREALITAVLGDYGKYGDTLEEIAANDDFKRTTDAVFAQDNSYVSITNDRGDTDCYIVEPHTLNVKNGAAVYPKDGDTLYVMKSYNDDDVHDTLTVEIYNTLEDARKALKEEVVSSYRSYGDTVEELMANPYFANDEFGEDHVKIHNDDGSCDYFEIEEYVRSK